MIIRFEGEGRGKGVQRLKTPCGGDAVIHPPLVELLRPVLPALIGPQVGAVVGCGKCDGLVVRLLRSDGEGDPDRSIVGLGVGHAAEAGDRIAVVGDDGRLESEQLGCRACADPGGTFPGGGRITSEQVVPSRVDIALHPPIDRRATGAGVR